jgi:putative oxidoreductase
MKQILFFSDNSWAGLVLRLTLGIIMLPHGAQKTFGLFGGYGFRPTMDYFTRQMNLPVGIAGLIILTESIGSVCLIAGFASRFFVFLFLAIMAGAILTTNYKNGLFMNWSGSQRGEGFEYHLLVIGICIGLLFTGGGKFSADGLICRVTDKFLPVF